MNKVIINSFLKSLTFSLIIAFCFACSEDESSNDPENDNNEEESTVDESNTESGIETNIDNSQILAIINEHREAGVVCNKTSKEAVPALEWDDNLAKAALDHSNDMQKNDYFSHDGLNGSSFSDRVKETDFDGFPVGENIAKGYQSEESVMDGWMNSEGHCKNIMNGNATHIGVARSDDGALWTMVLGNK
ncbi:CAP domain-containing protein [Reichenbachiella versicolor]|uniref:CAP domain-containing protein n=1 Tax=Reichenbachiella versicolor TaxID=1821036 RepID=UPI0013A54857|nr:CAP domain-containing protein [Reichenbachiella versicolor]